MTEKLKTDFILGVILNDDFNRKLPCRDALEYCLKSKQCIVKPNFLREYRDYWYRQLKNAKEWRVKCKAYGVQSTSVYETLKPYTRNNDIEFTLEELYGHLTLIDAIQYQLDNTVKSLSESKIKKVDSGFLKTKSNYLKRLQSSKGWFEVNWGTTIGFGIGIGALALPYFLRRRN